MSTTLALAGIVAMGLSLGAGGLQRRLVARTESWRTLRAYSRRERRSMERRLLRGEGEALPRSYLMAMAWNPYARSIVLAIGMLSVAFSVIGVGLLSAALFVRALPGADLWNAALIIGASWVGGFSRLRRAAKFARRALPASAARSR